MVLGGKEKGKFRRLMRAVEGFSGVKVLTYAILESSTFPSRQLEGTVILSIHR